MSVIEKGEALGKRFKDANITTSQLRKFLSAVNSIQNKLQADEKDFNTNEVEYLRVKLAYQAGREPKLKPFYAEIDTEIKKAAISSENFKEFARLIEAIVAYHKFYGGN